MRPGFFLALWLILCFFPGVALSDREAGKYNYIRDDETERYLKEIAAPIFKAGGLNAAHVKIHIVNSPVLNAFVAGGQHIFIHTGLILESEDPSVLIGVIAHETGHIIGGHLLRKQQEMEEATIQSAITSVLGLASMAAGAPGAGGAILSGGQHVAQRSLLKYSRGHEAAADQAAIDILRKVGVTPRGLLMLLEKFFQKQVLEAGQINPYALTHPPSQERITHIRTALEQHPEWDKAVKGEWQAHHRMVRAKLRGFLEDPRHIGQFYPASRSDKEALYAQAVAAFRAPDLPKAMRLMEQLIGSEPENPYFHELKGQMLFENGKVAEALPAYWKAVALAPEAPMMRYGLAVAQLALGEGHIKDATRHLERVVLIEPKNASAWRQLGIAYGRQNQLGLSYLALAEEALILGKKKEGEQYARLAERHLPQKSRAHSRLKDLRAALQKLD